MTKKKKTEGNPNGAGRTMKATEDTLGTLFMALKDGNTRRDACILAGISEDTLAAWIKGPMPQESALSHSDFSDQLAIAELHAKNESIKQVRAGGRKDWKAAAWWLKNRHRDEFHEREEHANPDGTALGVIMYPPSKNVPGSD